LFTGGVNHSSLNFSIVAIVNLYQISGIETFKGMHGEALTASDNHH
jgi:hypothetical protein